MTSSSARVNASAAVPPTQATPAGSRAAPWFRRVRLLSLVTIVVALLLLMRLLPIDRVTALLSAKIEHLGVWGPIAFAAAYILAAVLFVPGAALTLAAGAIFGLVTGTIVVSVASTLAAAISFLTGRYLARNAVHRWAGNNPRFAAIDRAIGQRGWKIVALLRLSPAVPFSLGNYLFGLTSIRFWSYVLTSWLAMLPGTFLYVYLGYAGRAGLKAAAGAGSGRTPGQWALLAVGLAATVVVTWYVTHFARKAIKENTAMPEPASKSTTTASPAAARSPILSTVLTAILALLLAGSTACAYAHGSWLGGLFGPPAVTMKESYKSQPSGPHFDHSLFDQVLHKYVNAHGLVDYRGLKAHPADLDAYIQSLANAPLKNMGRNERLALLLNAYNACTLRLILDHYPLKSIKDIPADQRWEAKRWNIGGTTYSLNQIEQEEIRPHFKEPRIHFALVCAAMGCPPLRNEAYQADRLDQQLDSQAQYVHSHDRWFQFDPKTDVVKLTSLYDWYGGDFEQAAGSVLNFAARYSPALKQALDAGRKPKVEFLDYDWSLNAQKDQPE
ncbi:MAG: VTT domain-containing protein [Planctomycetota bacterium]